MVLQDIQHNIQLSQPFLLSVLCSPGKQLLKGSIPQPLNSRPAETHLILTCAHNLSQQCFCNSHYSLFHACALRVIAAAALCAVPVSPVILWLQSIHAHRKVLVWAFQEMGCKIAPPGVRAICRGKVFQYLFLSHGSTDVSLWLQ